MPKIYTELTDRLNELSQEEIGEWVIDGKNDGTPEHPIQMAFVNYSTAVQGFQDAVYKFHKEHPEFELNDYENILQKNGIEWGINSMDGADVSQLDGQCIMALLMGAIRAERFCDGALLGFFKRGSIHKWLERLKDLDDEC